MIADNPSEMGLNGFWRPKLDLAATRFFRRALLFLGAPNQMSLVVRFANLSLVLAATMASLPVFSQTIGSHSSVKIEWITISVPTVKNQVPVPIYRNSPRLFTKVTPKDLFTTSIDMRDGPLRMTSGGNSIPAGTLLARSSNLPERFCELARRRKQNFIYCVEDWDRDGLLDTISGVPTMVISGNTRNNYEILIGSLETKFSAPLESPVSISSLSPVFASENASFDVMLTQTSKKSIALCIWRYAGNPLIDGLGYAPFCGPSWNLTTTDLPKIVSIYGGKFEVVRSSSGTIEVQIDPPPAGLSFPN